MSTKTEVGERIFAGTRPTLDFAQSEFLSPRAPDSEALQTPEEEHLQILNQDIQTSREELAILLEAEEDWDIYERPRVKHHIIRLEDERSLLVREYNERVRGELAAKERAGRQRHQALETPQPSPRRSTPGRRSGVHKSHRGSKPSAHHRTRRFAGSRKRSRKHSSIYRLMAALGSAFMWLFH